MLKKLIRGQPVKRSCVGYKLAGKKKVGGGGGGCGGGGREDGEEK